MTTLMNERVSIGGDSAAAGRGAIGEAVRLYRERFAGDRTRGAAGLRDEVLQSWVRSRGAAAHQPAGAGQRAAGTPGPEGSVAKLAFAEENKRIYELCVDLMGADGMLTRTTSR